VTWNEIVLTYLTLCGALGRDETRAPCVVVSCVVGTSSRGQRCDGLRRARRVRVDDDVMMLFALREERPLLYVENSVSAHCA
jgi:hypothetical protein